jgi:hypothetical protein
MNRAGSATTYEQRGDDRQPLTIDGTEGRNVVTNSKAGIASLSLALTGAVIMGLLLAVAPVAHAGAEVGRQVGTWETDGDKNGKNEKYTLIDFGKYYVVDVYDYADNRTYHFKFDKSGNPNPDGSGEAVNMATQIALAKQRGGPVAIKKDFWDTPEGRIVSSRAPSLGPVWNPGASRGGSSEGNPSGEGGYSDSATLKKKAEQDRKTAAGKGGSFISSEGGPVREQIKRKQRQGSGSGSNSEDGDDQGSAPAVDVSGQEKLPGPPELVNPSPVQR